MRRRPFPGCQPTKRTSRSSADCDQRQIAQERGRKPRHASESQWPRSWATLSEEVRPTATWANSGLSAELLRTRPKASESLGVSVAAFLELHRDSPTHRVAIQPSRSWTDRLRAA